jgi:hypothetical protein
MPLTLSLTFGNPPSTQEFPGTPKALGDFLAQYFAITGGAGFIPVNFGSTTPDSDSRGYPWFKTDGSGNPVGWFSWNGSTWAQLVTNVTSGPTANRPGGAAVGDLYNDTDIDVMLKYNGSAWVTAAGSPGDLKFVNTTTLADALTRNPGWSQADEPTMSGRVLGAAGTGTSLTPRVQGDSVGEEAHTLVIDEIPEHQHTASGINNTRWKADGNATDAAGNLSGWGSNLVSSNPPTGEGGLAHQTMQPTWFAWLLQKD